MFKLEDLYEELALRHNLTVDQVEKIARAQFKFILKNIQSGEFKIINIIRIGQFVPNFNSIRYRGLEFYESYPKRSNIPYPERWEKDKTEGCINKENVRYTRDNARAISQQKGDSNEEVLSNKE